MRSWQVGPAFQYFFARAAVVSLATAILLGAQTPSRADVATKRVLMLQSFGLHFKPWTDYAEILRSEIGDRNSR
jgi:purine nucleoside permease